MQVEFLQDFQGKETREIFYAKGQVAELDGGVAERLIADGRAVAVRYERFVGGQLPDVPRFEPDPIEQIIPGEVVVKFTEQTEAYRVTSEEPKPAKKRGKK